MSNKLAERLCVTDARRAMAIRAMANERPGGDSPGFMLFGAKIVMGIGQLVKQDHGEAPAVKDVPPSPEKRMTREEKDEPPSPEKRTTGDQVLPCPRCKSKETKFCYFNNYNVNQPRHFCRSCRRYWTAGGKLRNVPVKTGRRKARLSSTKTLEWLLQSHEFPAKMHNNSLSNQIHLQ